MVVDPRRLGERVPIVVMNERVDAFVPPALPPVPAVDPVPFMALLGRADRALGRLDGIVSMLPRQELFLYLYVRKEALLSSQIEGTQSTLTDLLRFEAAAEAGVPIDDVREVSNYVDALIYGVERLRDLPLSLRLVRELHARLLRSGRGEAAAPGEFRRTQNWIGGLRPSDAMFVPPPVDRMHACLDALERFIHAEDNLPPLIRAAMLHVQFETIHPFLDGNGRVGRLLVILYLLQAGVLAQPLLYLSLYLKTHRRAYYDHLQAVREAGDWEGWIGFFLEGVAQTAEQAYGAAQRILDLHRSDRDRVTSGLPNPNSALRVLEVLRQTPFVTAASLVDATGLSTPTANAALAQLETLGIVREVTGRRRGRVFAYDALMAILSEGTEPLPR
ncbi:Fic family protein [Tistrella mobilis]